MSEEWQPGDLALCIHDKKWCPHASGERAPDLAPFVVSMLFPRVGSEWRVLDVRLYESPEEQAALIYLMLAGQPTDYLYDARCFTKLREHKADAEDAETIRLLNGAPVVEPAQ